VWVNGKIPRACWLKNVIYFTEILHKKYLTTVGYVFLLLNSVLSKIKKLLNCSCCMDVNRKGMSILNTELCWNEIMHLNAR
jgi:hypothetical protein